MSKIQQSDLMLAVGPGWLDEALNAIGNPTNWDVLLVGDGSGSRFGYPGGWATLLFDHNSGTMEAFYGAVNDTTVNIMELMPYLTSMLCYSRSKIAELLKKRLRADTSIGVATRLIQVHIITDCEVLVKQGRNEWDRTANLPLWRAMETFERLGYELHWHWIERETLALNRLCDIQSKRCRKALKDHVDRPLIHDDLSA